MLPVHNKLVALKKSEILSVKAEAFTPDLSVHVCVTVHTQSKGAPQPDSTTAIVCFLEPWTYICLLFGLTKQDREIHLNSIKKKTPKIL